MLHEILLSLSGHPSPLLSPLVRVDAVESNGATNGSTILTPPERDLLSKAASLSELHVRLLDDIACIANEHPSALCRAVATAIDTVHLAAFRAKILQVENAILCGDASFVGAYNIVPLTAIVAEFSPWKRPLEWLCETARFMLQAEAQNQRGASKTGSQCTGAMLIDHLREELQTGYADIEEIATDLTRVAETAWLKQVSAWILYGRLPGFGAGDFFVKHASTSGGGSNSDQSEEFVVDAKLLPKFVAPSTAAAMLFIGRSLNYIRARSSIDTGVQGLDNLSSQLGELSALTFPLSSTALTRAIASIRSSLSKNTLQRLLPLSKVVEILQLLRGFFLLGRGEFAMILIHQADERLQVRWKRMERLAYDGHSLPVTTITIKEGEAAAVLAQTWAALAALQGHHSAEDEGLELARDLIRLTIFKSQAPMKLGASVGRDDMDVSSSSSFHDFLLGAPVLLTLEIPAPIDLFLSKADLHTYSTINAYLLSLRRAHIHLTDLWKISSLRRHYPPPPPPPHSTTIAGRERTQVLRTRQRRRTATIRAAWATASAAVFFLGETERYLQDEVVDGLSEGFMTWLTGFTSSSWQRSISRPASSRAGEKDVRFPLKGRAGTNSHSSRPSSARMLQLLQPQSQPQSQPQQQNHDPQTLALAHRNYLRALSHAILLTCPSFIVPLRALLRHVDQLATCVRALGDFWLQADMLADDVLPAGMADGEEEGREEAAATEALREAEANVRSGIRCAVEALRGLVGREDLTRSSRLRVGHVDEGGRAGSKDVSQGKNNTVKAAEKEHEQEEEEEEEEENKNGDYCNVESLGVQEEEEEEDLEDGRIPEEGEYVPRRVGGVDRLLMKLDSGEWFGG